MANEPEVIRQQMDETRTNLTDKLEMLENQVVETVQGTQQAVAETVETVKDAVQDTVQSVKDSVNDTVAGVKDTFDLRRHVNERPWTMMAGATVLGFLGGKLFGKNPKSEKALWQSFAPGAPSVGLAAPGSPGPREYHNGAPSNGKQPSASPAEKEAGPSFLGQFGHAFHQEIDQMKKLAIGTLLGVVRDMVAKNVPGPVEKKVSEVIDGLTAKLGGEPVVGPVLAPKTPSFDPEDQAEASLPGGNGAHRFSRDF